MVEVVRFFCYSVIVGLKVLLEESIENGGDDYAQEKEGGIDPCS